MKLSLDFKKPPLQNIVEICTICAHWVAHQHSRNLGQSFLHIKVADSIMSRGGCLCAAATSFPPYPRNSGVSDVRMATKQIPTQRTAV